MEAFFSITRTFFLTVGQTILEPKLRHSFAGRLNRNTNREEIIGTQGEGIPREDLQAMITDAKQCPELIG